MSGPGGHACSPAELPPWPPRPSLWAAVPRENHLTTCSQTHWDADDRADKPPSWG